MKNKLLVALACMLTICLSISLSVGIVLADQTTPSAQTSSGVYYDDVDFSGYELGKYASSFVPSNGILAANSAVIVTNDQAQNSSEFYDDNAIDGNTLKLTSNGANVQLAYGEPINYLTPGKYVISFDLNTSSKTEQDFLRFVWYDVDDELYSLTTLTASNNISMLVTVGPTGNAPKIELYSGDNESQLSYYFDNFKIERADSTILEASIAQNTYIPTDRATDAYATDENGEKYYEISLLNTFGDPAYGNFANCFAYIVENPVVVDKLYDVEMRVKTENIGQLWIDFNEGEGDGAYGNAKFDMGNKVVVVDDFEGDIATNEAIVDNGDGTVTISFTYKPRQWNGTPNKALNLSCNSSTLEGRKVCIYSLTIKENGVLDHQLGNLQTISVYDFEDGQISENLDLAQSTQWHQYEMAVTGDEQYVINGAYSLYLKSNWFEEGGTNDWGYYFLMDNAYEANAYYTLKFKFRPLTLPGTGLQYPSSDAGESYADYPSFWVFELTGSASENSVQIRFTTSGTYHTNAFNVQVKPMGDGVYELSAIIATKEAYTSSYFGFNGGGEIVIDDFSIVKNIDRTPISTNTFAPVCVGVELDVSEVDLEVKAGEQIDFTNLKVNAVYSNGDKVLLESSAITLPTDYDTSFGERELTISAEYGGETYTETVTCSFVRELVSLQIEDSQVKKEYKMGESLDLTNLVVKAVYHDDYVETLVENVNSGYTIDSNAFINTLEGDYNIIINFKDKSATIVVSVVFEDLGGNDGGDEGGNDGGDEGENDGGDEGGNDGGNENDGDDKATGCNGSINSTSAVAVMAIVGIIFVMYRKKQNN